MPLNRRHLDHCISSLLDQNCKFVSLKGLQMKWQALHWYDASNLWRYTNLFCHIKLLNAQEGLTGIQIGCDLSLKQLDKDKRIANWMQSRTTAQLGPPSSKISLLLIQSCLGHIEVFYLPRLCRMTLFSNFIHCVRNVLSSGLPGDPNRRSAPLLSDSVMLPREIRLKQP